MTQTLNTFILPRAMSLGLAMQVTELLLEEPIRARVEADTAPSMEAYYLLTHLMTHSWSIGGIFELREFALCLGGITPQTARKALAALTPTNAREGSSGAEHAERWQRTLEAMCDELERGSNLVEVHAAVRMALRISLERPLTLREAPFLQTLLVLHEEFAAVGVANLRRYAAGSGECEAGDDAQPVLLTDAQHQPLGLFASHAAARRFMLAQRAAGAAGASDFMPATGRTTLVAQPPSGAHAMSEQRAPLDPSKPSLRVFDPEQAATLFEQNRPRGPGDGNPQQARMFEMLANDTGVRPLAEVADVHALDELYERFPHFHEPLDFVANCLALAACGQEGSQVRIAPMLLRGKPGTGKTYFAQELARVLGVHFVERDLSVTSEAFVLTGIGPTWRGAKPGVVFDAVVNGPSANPLILLNEVDKAKTSGEHNSPISAMYALLEPTSAARFVDEFAPLDLNASRVIWVLTANDGHIPEPVLSRLEVFDIRDPDLSECRAIARSVWRSVTQTALPVGHGFSEELPTDVLDEVSMMSPRDMRKALTRAAGITAVAGRKQLQSADLQTASKRYVRTTVKNPIGFAPAAQLSS